MPAAPQHTTRIAPGRRSLFQGLTSLVSYRELLFFFVWKEVKVRYKQTVIGGLWAVLQPLMTALVFSLFFGRLASLPSQGLPYPIFFFSALLPWTYFASSVMNATDAMVENRRVITKVYFPRIILPLASTLSPLVDFALAFVVLLIMLVVYGVVPGWKILLLPGFLLLAVLTAMGAGLWLAALNALYRDIKYVTPFLIQIWMFLSPVVYPASLIPEKWQWLYGLNPMAGVIEGFRWCLTGSGQPPGAALPVSAAAVVVILLLGLANFNRMEGSIADTV